MTTLIFVRHGESETNIQKVFAGQSDIELTERGKKQAELSANYIKEHYFVDKIFSSDLKRAMTTARPIADFFGIEIIPVKAFREIFGGKWEMEKYDNLPNLFPKDYANWLENIGLARPTGGESVQEMANRVWAAVQDIAKTCPNQTVVITTHATPIRTTIARLQGTPIEQYRSVPWCGNASITVVSVENDDWQLEKVNITEHLAESQTSLPANI